MTDGNAVRSELYKRISAASDIRITYKDVGNVRHFFGA